MRALALTLAALLVIPSTAGAQQAWAKAYEDGVKAFENGNDALAEQKLKEARDHDRAPKQSRRANFSSVVYRPFIPDFYLGVIYARQGRHKQAQEYLERAIRDELVKQDDKANFALATTSLQRARDEQTRLASSVKPTPPDVRPTPPPTTTTPPATTTPTNPNTQTPSNNAANTTSPTVRPTPPPVTPPANTEPAWLPKFRQAMEAARTSLRQSRYTEARGSLASAESLAGDAARRQEALSLRRDIEMAQSVASLRAAGRARSAIQMKNLDAALEQVAALQGLDPNHTALPELRSGIERLRGAAQGVADLARVERRGVKLFLSGNYKDSAAELERAVNSGVRSPRIHLFLASSRAAQALLAPQNERPALIAEARKHYALARPAAGTLAADQRFISRSILQLLSGG
jgi:tetratricopeptide (TPR) repeat protein